MKKYLYRFTQFMTALVLLLTLVFFFTPLVINRYLPSILADNGMLGMTVEIQQISPWHLQGIYAAGDDSLKPGIEGGFHIDYSPQGLLHGRVDALSLSGTTVRMTLADGNLIVHGFPSPQTHDESKAASFTLPPLPMTVDQILLRNIQILLESNNSTLLPAVVRGTIHPKTHADGKGGFILNGIQADISAEGSIPASFHLDGEKTDIGAHIQLTGRVDELAAISRLLPLPEEMKLKGAVTVETEMEVDKSFTNFTRLKSRINFPGLAASANGFTVVGPPEKPLSLVLTGTGKTIDFTIANLALANPAVLQAELSGTFHADSGTLRGNGTLQSPQLQQPANLIFSSELNKDKTRGEISLAGDKQQLQIEDQIVDIGPYQVRTLFHIVNGTPDITSELQMSSVAITSQKLLLEKISAALHYTPGSTVSDTSPIGTLAINGIHYNKENVANLTTTFSLIHGGIGFAGELQSHRSRTLLVKFSGSSTTDEPVNLAYTLPATQIGKNSIPGFVSLPKGLTFSARVEGKGSLTYGTGGIHGYAKLSVTNGTLDMNEQKIHAKGLAADLTLPILPYLMSSPSQQLKIAAMEIGNLKFTDGRITFRVEDTETVFIEQSRLTWCGGKVESGSLRISLKNPELNTTLYCDRLQFTDLLSQLGITDAEGDGSLNGRLPLEFNGKELVFDDGFLFSTPGNGGIVRFSNTAMLRQSLPESGQAAHLEYSMQAMENFSYNWTKLTFNSKGDDLQISMQIDGKPTTPLPFGYKNGQLVQTAAGSGIQHPIRLDVNFHLPFAQMFKYGQSFQKMMKQ